MDSSDTKLTFDSNGWCIYCQNFHKNIKPVWHTDHRGLAKILPTIEKIKYEGRHRDHDCLIGISGGLDSSYAAYIAAEKFGLRPLMFHCDTGWNSDLGVSNIQKIIEGLNLDLVTEVVNWEEMKDLQRAFFLSQVSFVDVPQDLALFSAMYNFAVKNDFKYIITGGNNATECIRESIEWTYFSSDTKHVLDIHKRFGSKELKTFPMCDIFKYKFYYRFIKRVRVIKLLDYVPFTKKEAINTLSTKFDWTPYQQKHYESRFTRFYESFWTPKKFGFDKRRAYLSSEILAGELTRQEALLRISKPELDEDIMEREFEYVATKLGWTVDEFREIFNTPNKRFQDYANNYFWITLGAKLANVLRIDNRVFR